MPFTAINPATEEFVAEFDAHSDADVERALAHAASAFEAWRATPVGRPRALDDPRRRDARE
jgi:acyl-CoA reductase-like NAD-dependent aldehyde dehydrogenase